MSIWDMLNDVPASTRELLVDREPVLLVTIHTEVFRFLQHRDDCAVAGSYAVNAYARPIQATPDLDLLSTGAHRMAAEIKDHLSTSFDIRLAVGKHRTRSWYRIEQDRGSGNRVLVEVRQVETLPPTRNMDGVLVVAPPELIARKVMASFARRDMASGSLDEWGVAVLLRTFPEFKTEQGPVLERLKAYGANEPVVALWRKWVTREILWAHEDEKFDW